MEKIRLFKMESQQRDIYYIFSGRFPSEKAHALYVAKFCESLVGEGYKTEVIVPNRRRDPSTYDTFFGIKKSFSVGYLPTLDLFGVLPHFFAFLLQYTLFTSTCFFFFLFRKRKNTLIFSNESVPSFLLAILGYDVVYEMHDYPERYRILSKLLFAKVLYILTQNNLKAEKLIKEFEVKKEKIIIEQNAVDLAQFAVNKEKSEARKLLGIAEGKIVLLYTGHLYAWKGVDTFAKAVGELSEEYIGICVGGKKEDVEKFTRTYEHIKKLHVVGYRPHSEVPTWLQAADMLILPNTAKESISESYTSPMKLFEYMASLRPIVASDLPSIRTIVSEKEVFFVPPDDPSALARMCEALRMDEGGAKLKIEASQKKVSENTWTKRTKRILSRVLSDR